MFLQIRGDYDGSCEHNRRTGVRLSAINLQQNSHRGECDAAAVILTHTPHNGNKHEKSQTHILKEKQKTSFIPSNKQSRSSGSDRLLFLDFFCFQSSKEEWQTMYFIGAALYIFGFIIFLICGSGDLQEWARLRRSAKPDATDISTSSSSQKSKERIPLIKKWSHKRKDLDQGMDLQKQLILLSQLPGNSKQKTIARLPEAVGHLLIPVDLQTQSLNRPKTNYDRSQSVKAPRVTSRSLEDMSQSNHKRATSVKSDSSKYAIRPIGRGHSPGRASVRSADSISDNEDPQLTLRRPSSESTNFFDTLEESVL